MVVAVSLENMFVMLTHCAYLTSPSMGYRPIRPHLLVDQGTFIATLFQLKLIIFPTTNYNHCPIAI